MSNDLMSKIIEFTAITGFTDLPDEMVNLAKNAIIDTVGVTLSGWHEPVVQRVKKVYMTDLGKHAAISSLWGEQVKATCEIAAIINGTASHALDFDDAAPGVVIHPSAPVLAAVLPLAEAMGNSGQEVIAAYAIGTEIMIRIGQILGFKHYELGWHATGTLGTIGATAACCSLLKCTESEMANAVAISASMAGGLQKNFGTNTKPLHVGLAASHAIQSTLLAKNGFTGNVEMFEKRGFFHAFGGGTITEAEIDEKAKNIHFGTPYDLLEAGLSVKKFPCCYATHRFINGALEFKQEYKIDLEDLEQVILTAPPGGLLPLVHNRPQTGLQAKFSAEYTVLAALHDGYIKLSSFEDQQVQRSEIQKLFSAVKVVEREGTTKDGQEIEDMPVELGIKLKNGQALKKKVFHAPGSKLKPMTGQERRDKWNDCLKHFVITNNVDVENEIAELSHTLYDDGQQIDRLKNVGTWLTAIQNIHLSKKALN